MIRLYDPTDRTADLFAVAAPGTTMVSPVDCTGAQGAGLALTFKKRWPGPCAWFKSAASKGTVRPGVLLYQHLLDGPTLLFFPTKIHWSEPSTLGIVREGLSRLPDIMTSISAPGPHPISKYPRRVALPGLGCGEGGLSWDDVRPLILAAAPQIERVGYEVHIFPPQPWRDRPRGPR